MRFFASWWERVSLRQIGAVIAVVAVIGLLSVQIDGLQRGFPVGVGNSGQSGEIWV
jgi:hypothetical protein